MENEEAGIELLKGYMKLNQEVSLYKCDGPSFSRATSFNKHYVASIF